MAALSDSLKRSVLLKTTIERFPWRTRAESGSYSVRVRSWSRTKISRSARAARSRASLLACGARFADLGKPGRVGEEQASLDSVHGVGVVFGSLGRAHHGFALAGFAAQKRTDERRLAGGARAEDDDVKLAPMLTGSNLGELLVRARPGPTDPRPAGSRLRPARSGPTRPRSRRRALGRGWLAVFRETQSSRPTQKAANARNTISTIKNAMPRPRDCRENRSCSSTSELSSQAGHAKHHDQDRQAEEQIRGSRSHAIRSGPRLWLTSAVSRETIAAMVSESISEREASCHTLIVTGSSPGCTNRWRP